MELDPNKLYTVTELADIFSLNRMTIYNWIRRKQIKSYKLGQLVRISGEDLNKFIQRR